MQQTSTPKVASSSNLRVQTVRLARAVRVVYVDAVRVATTCMDARRAPIQEPALAANPINSEFMGHPLMEVPVHVWISSMRMPPVFA